MKNYFYLDTNGDERGPIDLHTIENYGINEATMVWNVDFPSWIKASNIPEFKHYLKDKGIETLSSGEIPYSTHKMEPPHPLFSSIDDSLKTHIELLKPKTWCIEALFVALFCALPFGVIALIYGARVNPLWREGRYPESIISSRKAGNWTKWGFFLALAFWIMIFLCRVFIPHAFRSVEFFNAYFGM